MTESFASPLRRYTPPGAIDHPPLEALAMLLGRLGDRGLPHALGASGLVAALGLTERVNDWDITVKAPIGALESACAGLRYECSGPSGCHADHKLGFGRERAELIAEFSFSVPGGVVRIPTLVTGWWQGIPVGSPTAWSVAYALMGELEASPRRRERAEALFAWLREGPVETSVRRALLEQPLPPGIADRVRALPA